MHEPRAGHRLDHPTHRQTMRVRRAAPSRACRVCNRSGRRRTNKKSSDPGARLASTFIGSCGRRRVRTARSHIVRSERELGAVETPTSQRSSAGSARVACPSSLVSIHAGLARRLSVGGPGSRCLTRMRLSHKSPGTKVRPQLSRSKDFWEGSETNQSPRNGSVWAAADI